MCGVIAECSFPNKSLSAWGPKLSRLYYQTEKLISQFIFWAISQLWPSLCELQSESIEKDLVSWLWAVFQVAAQMNGLPLTPVLTRLRLLSMQEERANSRQVRAIISVGARLKGAQPLYWWRGHTASISNCCLSNEATGNTFSASEEHTLLVKCPFRLKKCQ